jgi:hypothetical protein
MALQNQQFKDLYDALAGAFTYATLKQLLLLKLGQELDRIILVGPGVTLPEVITTVMLTSVKEGWTRQLVISALEAVPGNAALQALAVSYPEWDPVKPPAPAVNWYETRFLRGKRVFLHRVPLRQNLAKLGAPNESRVMVVNGPRLSGKTYSRDFIQTVTENDPVQTAVKHHHVYLNVDEFALQPADLAASIGIKLRLGNPPPPKGEQDTAWVPKLVDWMIPGFKEPDLWWLVLDGFRVQTHASATHDLIAQLVDAAESSLISNLRVVLLNYGDRLPAQLGEFVFRENIEPVERRHVEEFVDYLFAKSAKTYTREHVVKATDQILEKVERDLAKAKAGQEEWLKYVSFALTDAIPLLSA